MPRRSKPQPGPLADKTSGMSNQTTPLSCGVSYASPSGKTRGTPCLIRLPPTDEKGEGHGTVLA